MLLEGTTYHYALPNAHGAASLSSVETTAWETAVSETQWLFFANGNDGMNTATGRVALYDTASNASAGGKYRLSRLCKLILLP